jgi:hypothetical protein
MHTRRPAGLWSAWVAWTTAGETIGFLVPAVVAAATARSPAAIALPLLLVAGAAEGALLGTAQAHVLRRALPGLETRRWVAVTSAAAVLAWLLGLLPSVAADAIRDWPVAIVIGLAAAGGLVLLCSIGIAQWTVLRHHVARAHRWVAITAIAWLAALGVFMLIATPLWREGQPVALTIAIGAFAGLAMAATMAAVSGVGLLRLLRGPTGRGADDGQAV